MVPSSSWLVALGALSCTGAPAGCDAIADEGLAGYCRLQEAAQARSPEEVGAICSRAGTWEPACREVWLLEAIRQNQYTRAELLAVATTDDARFLVLDAMPEVDVLAQVAACEAMTGPLACDCTWHAVDRWSRNRRTPAEIQRVAYARMACTEQHAAGVGRAVGCSGAGSCDGVRRTDACQDSAATAARDPAICVPWGYGLPQ